LCTSRPQHSPTTTGPHSAVVDRLAGWLAGHACWLARARLAGGWPVALGCPSCLPARLLDYLCCLLAFLLAACSLACLLALALRFSLSHLRRAANPPASQPTKQANRASERQHMNTGDVRKMALKTASERANKRATEQGHKSAKKCTSEQDSKPTNRRAIESNNQACTIQASNTHTHGQRERASMRARVQPADGTPTQPTCRHRCKTSSAGQQTDRPTSGAKSEQRTNPQVSQPTNPSTYRGTGQGAKAPNNRRTKRPAQNPAHSKPNWQATEQTNQPSHPTQSTAEQDR
jgi:hypothetical protein